MANINLDLKKAQVELLNVSAQKASLELRIEERLDEIEQLKGHITISGAKEEELKKKISEMMKLIKG